MHVTATTIAPAECGADTIALGVRILQRRGVGRAIPDAADATGAQPMAGASGCS